MRFSTLIAMRDRLLLVFLASAAAALVALAMEGAPKLYSGFEKIAVAEPEEEREFREERLALFLVDESDAADVKSLNAAFDRIGFDLGQIASGNALVPRVILASLPNDIHETEITEEKKAVFLRALLPIVLSVNDQIEKDRLRLLALRDQVQKGKTLSGDDVLWVLEVARKYDQPDADLDALAKKIDIVPNSMALAQAITESGWGTSRIAREMNALYGQYKSRDGWGYRSFSDLYGTVASYARNLNTHNAYREFRRQRAAMRAGERTLDADILVGSLQRYSELGDDYIRMLRVVMKDNQLLAYDGAQLDMPPSDFAMTHRFMIR